MASVRWLVWPGAAPEEEEGGLQAAHLHRGRLVAGKVLLQGLWAEVLCSQRSPRGSVAYNAFSTVFPVGKNAGRPAAGRVLQRLGALLLSAEPCVMLCQVLQSVLLQQEPPQVWFPMSSCAMLLFIWLLQQLSPDNLCVPHSLQDVLLRRLKAEVMGELPPKRRQVGPQALCSVLLINTPDM